MNKNFVDCIVKLVFHYTLLKFMLHKSNSGQDIRFSLTRKFRQNTSGTEPEVSNKFKILRQIKGAKFPN